MLNNFLINVNILVGDSMDIENDEKDLDKKLDELPEVTDQRIHEFLTNVSHNKRINMNPYKIYEEITKEK